MSPPLRNSLIAHSRMHRLRTNTDYSNWSCFLFVFQFVLKNPSLEISPTYQIASTKFSSLKEQLEVLVREGVKKKHLLFTEMSVNGGGGHQPQSVNFFICVFYKRRRML